MANMKTLNRAKRLKGFKILLLKAYLDKGMGLTYYVKYLIALFGISSLDVKTTMIISFAWMFLSFFIGWIWYRYKLVDTETEIGNLFNPFVKEMRSKI